LAESAIELPLIWQPVTSEHPFIYLPQERLEAMEGKRA
jgi:hypothetical protein